jgi:RIO-like serine/threonine protein kinase
MAMTETVQDTTVLSEGRNRTKARVRLVRWNDGTAVEKDYSTRGFLMRRLVGPLILNREERALTRLAGTAGIPAFLARPTRDRLVMERLPGQTLAGMGSARARAELPAGFFGRLLTLVKILHRRGVAQRDIGAGDVLVAGDGEPGLVDFSVSVRQRRGPFNALLFRSAIAQDLRRVARLHQRFSPGDLTEEERGYLEHEPALNRWAHRLRRLVPGRKR